MTIVHHLDDSTLLRYASGDLDAAFASVVSAHIALCGQCRRVARLGDEIGGQLLEEAGPADLAPGAFDRLMARVEGSAEPIVTRRGAPGAAGLPLPLARLVGASLDAIAWRTIAPGVRKHAIGVPGAGGSSLLLLNVAPGRAIPEHGHRGGELTLVLTGAYRDAMGRFGPGDVADLDEHVEHRPRVEPDRPCICLIAVEAPARFKGLLSRALQPFIGL